MIGTVRHWRQAVNSMIAGSNRHKVTSVHGESLGETECALNLIAHRPLEIKIKVITSNPTKTIDHRAANEARHRQ